MEAGPATRAFTFVQAARTRRRVPRAVDTLSGHSAMWRRWKIAECSSKTYKRSKLREPNDSIDGCVEFFNSSSPEPPNPCPFAPPFLAFLDIAMFFPSRTFYHWFISSTYAHRFISVVSRFVVGLRYVSPSPSSCPILDVNELNPGPDRTTLDQEVGHTKGIEQVCGISGETDWPEI